MNKVAKIIIGVLIVIVVIWGIIFAIDYNRCSNMKQPIFVILKQSTDFSLKTETYQGLGYKVEVQKDVTKDNKEQITKVEMYMFNKFITGAISEIEKDSNDVANNTKLERIIMVNGKLYYDTGKESTFEVRCGTMDGKITSNVNSNEIPTENNQSNFDGNYGYQYGTENTIEVNINDKWYIFETKEENVSEQCSFYGKIIESKQNYILVEPNEDEEERKSSDKISIGLGENNDAMYTVGTNVKITYNGIIMESYPAQIKATKIEIKSAEEFEIRFYDKQQKSEEKIHSILEKSETDKYNYNIYTYGGNVNILINGKELSLRNALLENKITMEEIIEKANKDFPNAVSYDDGGSMEYHYDNYTIIKIHKLNGNRDVYIGTKDMTLNDLKID